MAAQQQQSPDILDDISHRRFNPLRNSWILVSPHRTKRPWQGAQEEPSKVTLPEYDEKCYLCPRNQRAAGDSNPDYESTYVFVNDYSAVKEDQPDYVPTAADGDKSALLLRAEGVKGKCFVICFHPSHNLTLADMTTSQITSIIKTWTLIYRSHLPPTSPYFTFLPPTIGISNPTHQYRYMQIFENKGAAMGCSNPHPHGQVWTESALPEEPALEITAHKHHRHKYSSCLLCDYLDVELRATGTPRTVFENAHFLALVPYWATWPFEILLLPKRCVSSLPELTPEEVESFAQAMSQVTIRYDNLFKTQFPYSMGIHQAPLVKEQGEEIHLHVHFYPPLLRSATVRKFLVGYEMLGEPQRDITAEQAARRLRELDGEVVYRKQL
ncbi:galactose-1-phosphate uridylyltransferase [Ascobolus immersus RN42]|uniref:Galactose-1-phosphate uridylyltransferase n=1 Tax=Ascobolus immersus RN42 TaxID=1160509 RepID=A0A3N4IRY8_ASCIM|nr:galactose-1-phosphate uridylyltransferase [Ascobolus immersus RN42]